MKVIYWNLFFREEYGGIVEEIKLESVKIAGKIFMRDQLEFRVDLVTEENPE
ncbi:hypothetical protein [Paenibacillus sp. EKM211P]|uniref:hypothetical protein n=1 Tax=Paenibacillus sp. EKM211P TaxID=1683679 RepID=UPI0013E94FA8|nr:hypothetical protein [Paenibacillus sp. EKM211P]KAF6582899.1 hypothetical protein G9G57_16130 [Paenibacillus sp. EKM211P]